MSYKKYVLLSPDEYDALRGQTSENSILTDKRLNSDEKLALHNDQLARLSGVPVPAETEKETRRDNGLMTERETEGEDNDTDSTPEEEEGDSNDSFKSVAHASPSTRVISNTPVKPATPKVKKSSDRKILSTERRRNQQERKQAEAENKFFDHFLEHSEIIQIDEQSREFAISGDWVDNSNIDSLVVLFATRKSNVPVGLNKTGSEVLVSFLKETGFENVNILNIDYKYKEREPSQRVIKPRLWS